MSQRFFHIFVVLVFLNSCSGQVKKISRKGNKYAILNERLRKNALSTAVPTTTTTPPTTTEDPFFSSDNDIFSDFDDAFEGIFCIIERNFIVMCYYHSIIPCIKEES